VAVTIVSILMVFVVPKFQEIFTGLLKGEPLPTLTQALLTVSYFMRDHFVVTIGTLIGSYVGFGFFRKTRIGARTVLIGSSSTCQSWANIALKAAIARFTRTFGTLLRASGVPILQALVITRDTSGNVHVANALNVVHDRVKEGDNVAKPLESTAIFPAWSRA